MVAASTDIQGFRPYASGARGSSIEGGRESLMMWYGGPGWGWGWLVMSLVMLAFWVLLVLGGIAMWRSLRDGDRRPRDDRRSAEQLLDERFARGEIDVDEYTRRREILRSGG
jgi:putative membrane protein